MDYKETAVKLILDKYDAIKLERETNLQNLKSSLQNHKTKLVFFGDGILGKSLYLLFQNEGIQADMFCDNNNKLWGDCLNSPDQVLTITRVGLSGRGC